MTENNEKFKIIFDKLGESIKIQEQTQSIDFTELMKMSNEIRSLEKIVNDSSLDDEPIILTRA